MFCAHCGPRALYAPNSRPTTRSTLNATPYEICGLDGEVLNSAGRRVRAPRRALDTEGLKKEEKSAW